MKRIAIWVAAAALGAAAPAAPAGPVTVQSGQVAVTFEPGDGSGPVSRSFDVAFPGAAEVSWDGREDDAGTALGLGSATYDLADGDTGATFNVFVSNAMVGPPATAGGETLFSLAFTTDRALRYDLEGVLRGVTVFEIKLDDSAWLAELTIRPGDDPIHGGNWPIIPGPRGHNLYGSVDEDGILPAGTHLLTVRARPGAVEDVVSSSAGEMSLVLSAADGPEPTPIPLPPAAWSGLVALAGMFGCRIARRRGGSATASWRAAYDV